MTVEQLSIELSIKLGDPVPSGKSDGDIFTSDTRLGYINRAYGKLYRVLKSLMRKNAPEFTKAVDYIRYPAIGYEEGETPYKNVYKLDPYIDIIDIYVFVQTLSNGTPPPVPDNPMNSLNTELNKYPLYKADRIAPYEFMNVLMKKNDFRVPSFEKGQIYYTILNKKLMFLPAANSKYVYKGYYMTKTSIPDNLKLEDDIYITNNYKDLLILFAAYEGMMDIANPAKVQIYGQEINGQLQILSNYAQLEQREEGVSEQRSE